LIEEIEVQLSEETKEHIAKSRAEFERREFYTLEEIKRELGL